VFGQTDRETTGAASWLIIVIGIASQNGILLLDADERFRVGGIPLKESMIQAERRRLTVLAAAAGMLPLALALDAGSQMLQPLAIAVIGGIVISVALSLIVTPAVDFYLSHGPWSSFPTPSAHHNHYFSLEPG
jgi:multidrug efflux pump subunit AcrB